MKNPSNNAKFVVSGTGNAIGHFHFFCSELTGQALPITKHNGRIRRIVMRQPAGGGATAVVIDFVQRLYVASADPATIPDEYIVCHVASQTPTASAKTAFFDSTVDRPPTFQEGLNMILSVTGVGAWSFVGYVELEN